MRKILKTINILNSIFLSILLGLSLLEIGLLTKEVSFIEITKEKIDQISKENQKLEDEVLNLNSISNLDQFLEKSNFVKAEKIKFVQILEGGVVAK
jgi:cell division protein FtsB